MSNHSLGFAVYVSTFQQQRQFLEKLKFRNIRIFTSLHISEELNETYVQEVEEMCEWLDENGFWVMADVSPLTLTRFNEENLSSLITRLHLDNVRLDFGFDLSKVKLDGIPYGVTYNASTILKEGPLNSDAFYMHNFYPRPETGLDEGFFLSLNERIQVLSAKTMAFIAGDKQKRGPLHEGLPTLESHRSLAPYAQFVDLIKNYKIDTVFLGDVTLSDYELDLIMDYLNDQIIRLPIMFSEINKNLYNQLYTVRVDSPSNLIRVQESRQYAQQGQEVEPHHMVKRVRGSVTMDNKNYKRYSGEIQITKADYPQDERVNTIGKLDQKYHLLLNSLYNGEKFMFVPAAQ